MTRGAEAYARFTMFLVGLILTGLRGDVHPVVRRSGATHQLAER
ncbi:MAG: hypothetical protein U1U88_000797 [Lawsonella clevelandensis]